MFSGQGPHLLFLGPQPIADEALAAGLAAAQAIAPATRQAERRVGLDDLPPLGRPGRELSRERIEDLGIDIVRFANGSTLTFKRTAFEQGEVEVQLRFGGGLSAMPADRPSLGWLGGLIGPSGIGEFDLDAMERMMTGRRINLAFAVEEDSFALRGTTSAVELGDQLRLLTAKLAFPRWDEGLFARFRTGALESYRLSFASAAARGGRESAAFTHPGDPRFRPVEREAIEAANLAAMRDYFAPLLSAGPVHVVIVGDTSLDAAADAVRRTVAALPARPPVARHPEVRPPAPNPEPLSFTHEGAPDQAYAAIGWSTAGASAPIGDRRALALAANLFRVRLFERLREAEGATYSPSGGHVASDAFPAWGIFYAGAELRPASTDAFFRAAREIVADLAARPVAADEFARAQNPVISGIERRLATNDYWSSVLGDFAIRPEAVAEVRAYLADYRAMTPERVRAAVAAYVADVGDWSMLVLPSRSPSPAPTAPAAAPATRPGPAGRP
jgi:zinc protease